MQDRDFDRSSSPKSIIRILSECARSSNFDFAESIFHTCWPSRSNTILAYFHNSLEWIGQQQAWAPPHAPLSCHRYRLGLRMSRSKFGVAKGLIRLLLQNGTSLEDLMQLKISPYVLLYVSMDLDIALPPSFDLPFFWRHVEQLFDRGRIQDLVHSSTSISPIPVGNQVAHSHVPNDTAGDPDGIIQLLYHHLCGIPSPEPSSPVVTVDVAASSVGTGGVLRGNPTSTFALRRRASNPSCIAAREAYALLDAACCWGHLWKGRVVRVTLSNPRLVWALNDFIDAAAEFPAVEALKCLGSRWGFKMEAIFDAGHLQTSSGAVARALASLEKDKFSRRTGLGLQLMDTVLMDCESEMESLGGDFCQVVLASYQSILAGCGAEGYKQWPPKAGMLYQEMRLQQTLPSKRVEDGPLLSLFGSEEGYGSVARRSMEGDARDQHPTEMDAESADEELAAAWRNLSRSEATEPRPDLSEIIKAYKQGVEELRERMDKVKMTKQEKAARAFGKQSIKQARQAQIEVLKRRDDRARKVRLRGMRARAAADDAYDKALRRPRLTFWYGQDTMESAAN